jgi:hypothetical protein
VARVAAPSSADLPAAAAKAVLPAVAPNSADLQAAAKAALLVAALSSADPRAAALLVAVSTRERRVVVGVRGSEE